MWMSVQNRAVEVISELLRRYTLEVIHRCEAIRASTADESIETQHLAKILPQLLLDF